MSIKLTKIFNGISWEDPEDILVYNGIGWESVQAVKVFNGISWETVWEPGGNVVIIGNSDWTFETDLVSPATGTVYANGNNNTVPLFDYPEIYIESGSTYTYDLDQLPTYVSNVWPATVYGNNAPIYRITLDSNVALPSGVAKTYSSYGGMNANFYVGNVQVENNITIDSISVSGGRTSIEVLPSIDIGDLLVSQPTGDYQLDLELNTRWTTNLQPITYNFGSNIQLHVDANNSASSRTSGVSFTDYASTNISSYTFITTTDYGSSILDISTYLPQDHRTDLLTGNNTAWLGWSYEVELVAWNMATGWEYVLGSNLASGSDSLSGTISVYDHPTLGNVPTANASITWNTIRDVVYANGTPYGVNSASRYSDFMIRTVVTDGSNTYTVYSGDTGGTVRSLHFNVTPP